MNCASMNLMLYYYYYRDKGFLTVPLGGEGMFYCETEGEEGQLWFNEIRYIDSGGPSESDWPEDIDVSFHLHDTVQDGVRITTINVTIPAKFEYNNTLVRCSDKGTHLTSRAYLTVQGRYNILHTATYIIYND